MCASHAAVQQPGTWLQSLDSVLKARKPLDNGVFVNVSRGVCAKLLQSCLTLCDAMDYSLPGSSVHGILQTRILEWVAMPSSKGSSLPRDRTHISYVSYIGRQVLYP